MLARTSGLIRCSGYEEQVGKWNYKREGVPKREFVNQR